MSTTSGTKHSRESYQILEIWISSIRNPPWKAGMRLLSEWFESIRKWSLLRKVRKMLHRFRQQLFHRRMLMLMIFTFTSMMRRTSNQTRVRYSSVERKATSVATWGMVFLKLESSDFGASMPVLGSERSRTSSLEALFWLAVLCHL